MATSDNKDLLARAKALLGAKGTERKVIGAGTAALDTARKVLEKSAGKLDIYIAFDTTGSMGSYIEVVRDNIATVTDELLKTGMRISINGIGDHCDGENWMQMYNLSASADEVRGALESVVMTSGGDTPEAYECLALALAQRIPSESTGRKRAVVLVADSVPHGMMDDSCSMNVDYQRAFAAMKTVCDGFYFVGCNEQMYAHQRKLIDSSKPDREQFIPLGSMVDVLPNLLVALAKKTESARALTEYLKGLESGKAQKIAGLLGKG